MRDDGYDIADYMGIHHSYGTMKDFKLFLREAHRRGLRVITELVINHTSDQHEWFQKARLSKPGSKLRDFYVWSDNPERYKEARIIFQDFESSNWTWDPVAKAYYWHRFYSHQPDLNFDSPQVHKALYRVLDYWMDMGVDGLRLDAVPYLYEREGTNCENLEETHTFLKNLRAHIEDKYENRMILAEANQWPEDAVAYFGQADECQMSFHFPLMPRLFMAMHMEDRFPIVDILDQTPDIPDSCQWAIFLRNHDELTLEMVTDEERDYMYRVYAQDTRMRLNLGIRRRLSPLLNNHRRRIELMNGLLFSMPGTPIIYYGDEIGMGDNIYLGDRNGVRTPMQWSSDRNAGFSAVNPQKLYLPVIIDPEYHYEVVNVENLKNNRHSLLWGMKRLIALRKQFKAFGRGTIEFLKPDNYKILAFVRRYEDEYILVVANLSRFVQCMNLDLASFEGRIPIEMFGLQEFPPITSEPYFMTLGPHSFYWFFLAGEHRSVGTAAIDITPADLPLIQVLGKWETLFNRNNKKYLEDLLPRFLTGCRWFGGKAREMKKTGIQDVFTLPNENGQVYVIAFIQVDFLEGQQDIYTLLLTCSEGEAAEQIIEEYPETAIARIRCGNGAEPVLLHEALVQPDCCRLLLELMVGRRRLKGKSGELTTTRTKAMGSMKASSLSALEPSVMRGEQSNTSVVYGERFIMKLIRRLGAGVNPDLEIGRFLTERGFENTSQVAGSIELKKGKDEIYTIGILQNFIPNAGDAWTHTQGHLGNFYEDMLARRKDLRELNVPEAPLLDMIEVYSPSDFYEFIGPYLESVRLLGLRTGELHMALASEPNDPKFAPEPFSKLYQRSLYQSMRTLVKQAMRLIRQRIRYLNEEIRPDMENVLELETQILNRFHTILDLKLNAKRIRCHGDYHLGQVLFTGKDFMIIDFEGEPARPISERKIKRCPLKDVAGMLRSFHYAAYFALQTQEQRGLIHPEDKEYMEGWADYWRTGVSAAFLKAYFEVANEADFLPKSKEETRILIDAYLLEKAVYELCYELNNRPEWIKIPLRGILELVPQEQDRS